MPGLQARSLVGACERQLIDVCMYLSLSLSLSLSLTHTHTHTHTINVSLPLFLSSAQAESNKILKIKNTQNSPNIWKVGKGKVCCSQARKLALRSVLSWPVGALLTSLTVGCHLNAAMGPAIIPFTVLDSGMVRSYRGKGIIVKTPWGPQKQMSSCSKLGSTCSYSASFSHIPPKPNP